MKKIGLFIFLIPLFSYLEIQEPWLIESSAPTELYQEYKENNDLNDLAYDKEALFQNETAAVEGVAPVQSNGHKKTAHKSSKQKSRIMHRYKRSDIQLNHQKSSKSPKKANQTHFKNRTEEPKQQSSAISSQQDKKHQKMRLHLETNRKIAQYLRQDSIHSDEMIPKDALVQEEDHSIPVSDQELLAKNAKKKGYTVECYSKVWEKMQALADKQSKEIAEKKKNGFLKTDQRAQKKGNRSYFGEGMYESAKRSQLAKE